MREEVESVLIEVDDMQYEVEVGKSLITIKNSSNAFFKNLNSEITKSFYKDENGEVFNLHFSPMGNDMQVMVFSDKAITTEKKMDTLIDWINENFDSLEEIGYEIEQKKNDTSEKIGKLHERNEPLPTEENTSTSTNNMPDTSEIKELNVGDKFRHHGIDPTWEILEFSDDKAKAICVVENDRDGQKFKKETHHIVDIVSILNPKESQNYDIFTQKTYLAVGFDDKDKAKQAGARWDKEKKLWFAPTGASRIALKEWLVENQEIKQMTRPSAEVSTDPIGDLENAMMEFGIDVNKALILDGRVHRLPMKGRKKGNKSGWYQGSIDDKVSATFGDWGTGEKKSWFENTKYVKLSPKEMEEKKATMRAKQAEREKEIARLQEFTAQAITKEVLSSKAVNPEHPYLVRKEVGAYDLRQDWRGNILIPLKDIDNKLWSVQRIWETPTSQGKIIGRIATKKEEEAGIEYMAKKENCFYVIGADHKDLPSINPIILVEGFATGASLESALNLPVIMAIDAGNLKKVAKTISERYPEKMIIIAGDNDLKSLSKGRENQGAKVSHEIAEELGALVALPPFNKEEIKKEYSDWNDLALSRGLEAVSVIFRDEVRKSKAKLAKKNSDDKVVEEAKERNAEAREKNKKVSQAQTNTIAQ